MVERKRKTRAKAPEKKKKQFDKILEVGKNKKTSLRLLYKKKFSFY